MLADLLKKRPALRYGLPAAIAAALACIAIDQFSKYLILGMNLREGQPLDVVPGILSFQMAWNDGINFGLLSGGGEFTRIAFSVVVCIVALVLILFSLACRRMLGAIALGIAAGGALGNAIDRLVHGKVADFLNVTCCGIDNPWYFNVADVFVFVGFGLLLIPPGRDKAETPAG